MIIASSIAVLVAVCLLSISYQHTVHRLFGWSSKYRCPITGKIFRDNCSCTEPCPCHGEKKVHVIARWRLRGWEVKEESDEDREVLELRRMIGIK
jgi:hypothetical protein